MRPCRNRSRAWGNRAAMKAANSRPPGYPRVPIARGRGTNSRCRGSRRCRLARHPRAYASPPGFPPSADSRLPWPRARSWSAALDTPPLRWHSRQSFASHPLAPNDADKGDVTEELSRLRSPSRLLPEGRRSVSGQGAGRRQEIGATVDQREHVGRFGRLRVSMAPDARYLEAERSQRLRKAPRQPGIVDEVGDHRADQGLEWIEVTDGNRGRHVVAFECGQPAVWPENTMGFAERRLGVGNVAERRVKHHQVEGRVSQVQRATVALHETEVRKMLPELTRPGDEHRRGVNSGHVELEQLHERPAHGPGAATDLQCFRTARKLELRQVRAEHRLLLRIGGPQL